MGLFNFTVTGGDKALAGLVAVQTNMQDLSPFWRDVWAPQYFAMVQDLFATSGTARGAGGRFTSGPWQRLSPQYGAWKAKFYPGQPLLTLTGRLRESLRWNGIGLGEEGIFEMTPTSVVAGTSVPYGRYHQTGTSKMPARNFLPLPDPKVFGPLLQQWILKTKQA
jgi:phage gpG-like protein